VDRQGRLAASHDAAPPLTPPSNTLFLDIDMRTFSTALLALIASAVLLLPNASSAANPKPAATATVAATPAALAQFQAAQSELVFGAQQMGVPFEGRFKRFDAQLSFDPKKPEAGHVAFTVDLTSVSLGDPSFDAELIKPDWFDTKKQSSASFQSSALKALGGGRFEVSGKLNIKGQARDLVVPLTIAQAAGVSTATGSFVIKRLEFKIGDGDWADTSMVANDVRVKFKLAFKGIAPL